MTSPGSRWQLLLMADDGHIIPFRRIKGLVLTFVVLFILLGLVCAGLGWWLVSKSVRLEETKKELLEAENQLVLCRIDLESRKSPPVEPKNKAETDVQRMEPVSAKPEDRQVETVPAEPEDRQEAPLSAEPEDRQVEPLSAEPPEKADSALAAPSPAVYDDNQIKPQKDLEAQPPMEKETGQPEVTVTAYPQKAPVGIPTADNSTLEVPVIALGNTLKVSFNETDKVLTARYRIKNTGPPSSPVQGRSLIVFKPDESGPDQWVAMPRVELIDGEPSGKQGKRFKISRFLDVTVTAEGIENPSIYTTTTVYVYDGSGQKITQKVYSVTLPLSD